MMIQYAEYGRLRDRFGARGAKEFGVGGLADSRSPPFFPGRALPCLRQRRAGEIKPNLQ